MKGESAPKRSRGFRVFTSGWMEERMFLCLTYEQRGKRVEDGKKGKAVQPLWQLVCGVSG